MLKTWFFSQSLFYYFLKQDYWVVFYDVFNFVACFLTSFTFVMTGSQVSPVDCTETVAIPCAEQTENTTESEQRDNPFCTLGNQGNSISTWTVDWKKYPYICSR